MAPGKGEGFVACPRAILRKAGAGLGKTTGWIHRTALRHRGVTLVAGATYDRIDDEGLHVDAASGISIPVPQGWTGQSGTIGAGVTTGRCTCPIGTGDNGKAATRRTRRGVLRPGGRAEALVHHCSGAAARKDISGNTKASYGDTSGGITSHQQLKSEAVTVAGRKGYPVRWKVVTEKGYDGYVQSLVFPSPSAANPLIVVRSGFEINAKAPKLSVIDDITRDIKASSVSGTGAGSGSGENA